MFIFSVAFFHIGLSSFTILIAYSEQPGRSTLTLLHVCCLPLLCWPLPIREPGGRPTDSVCALARSPHCVVVGALER
jgi:hypothetical protein